MARSANRSYDTAAVMTAFALFSPGGFRGAGPALRLPGMWIALAYLGLLATTVALWAERFRVTERSEAVDPVELVV